MTAAQAIEYGGILFAFWTTGYVAGMFITNYVRAINHVS